MRKPPARSGTLGTKARHQKERLGEPLPHPVGLLGVVCADDHAERRPTRIRPDEAPTIVREHLGNRFKERRGFERVDPEDRRNRDCWSSRARRCPGRGSRSAR